MSGPENNPRDDEAIDRESYEKWEREREPTNQEVAREILDGGRFRRHMLPESKAELLQRIVAALDARDQWWRENCD